MCDNNWLEYNGHCYLEDSTTKNWANAKVNENVAPSERILLKGEAKQSIHYSVEMHIKTGNYHQQIKIVKIMACVSSVLHNSLKHLSGYNGKGSFWPI